MVGCNDQRSGATGSMATTCEDGGTMFAAHEARPSPSPADRWRRSGDPMALSSQRAPGYVRENPLRSARRPAGRRPLVPLLWVGERHAGAGDTTFLQTPAAALDATSPQRTAVQGRAVPQLAARRGPAARAREAAARGGGCAGPCWKLRNEERHPVRGAATRHRCRHSCAPPPATPCHAMLRAQRVRTVSVAARASERARAGRATHIRQQVAVCRSRPCRLQLSPGFAGREGGACLVVPLRCRALRCVALRCKRCSRIEDQGIKEEGGRRKIPHPSQDIRY